MIYNVVLWCSLYGGNRFKKTYAPSKKNTYQVYLSRVHAGMVLLSQVQVQRRVESQMLGRFNFLYGLYSRSDHISRSQLSCSLTLVKSRRSVVGLEVYPHQQTKLSHTTLLLSLACGM